MCPLESFECGVSCDLDWDIGPCAGALDWDPHYVLELSPTLHFPSPTWSDIQASLCIRPDRATTALTPREERDFYGTLAALVSFVTHKEGLQITCRTTKHPRGIGPIFFSLKPVAAAHKVDKCKAQQLKTKLAKRLKRALDKEEDAKRSRQVTFKIQIRAIGSSMNDVVGLLERGK